MFIFRGWSAQEVNEIKNYIIVIMFVAVIILGAICYNSSIGNRELDNRIAELSAENDRIAEESERLAGELERTVAELQDSNSRLAKLTDRTSEIATGLSEVGSGIQGVIDRMSEYVKKPH